MMHFDMHECQQRKGFHLCHNKKSCLTVENIAACYYKPELASLRFHDGSQIFSKDRFSFHFLEKQGLDGSNFVIMLLLYIEAHALYLTRTATTHTRRTIIAHFFSFFNPTNLLTVHRVPY